MFQDFSAHGPDDETRRNINHIDEMIVQLLDKVMATDPNTIVIVMGDHGKREGEQPLFNLAIPDTFLQDRPGMAQILDKNQERLISWFDVHTTLLSLLEIEDAKVMNIRNSIPRKTILTHDDETLNLLPLLSGFA